PDKQTAIIKIDIFTRYLTDGIKKQLLEAKSKGAKNIVFDLTLNRGGSVQATWEILGYLANNKYKYNKYYPLSKDKVITNIKYLKLNSLLSTLDFILVIT
ncbi:S41 family peptidase, partial [Mycoplasmopsis bovis]|uniref:S41 family peptidase n=1 Tax=Mycoplasmopsis bovis TaxID=28903 RepID=UPI003D27705F